MTPLPYPDDLVMPLLAVTDRAIYGLDREGRCTFANEACLSRLGAAHESDLVGRVMHTLVHHTDANGGPNPADACAVHRVDDAPLLFAARERVWRLDGKSFVAEYWSSPILHDGDVVGRLIAFVDIT